MRFERYPKIAFTWTSRKIAALRAKQRREREASPLFAPQIAAAQEAETPNLVEQKRRAAWEREAQDTRTRIASRWRRARRALRALPEADRRAVLERWQRAFCPGSHEYLAGHLTEAYRRLGLIAMPRADYPIPSCAEQEEEFLAAARFRFGLFDRGGELVGVAVFSVPVNYRSLDRFQLDHPDEGVDLGRLVLLNECPAMSESLLVAEAFRRLRREGIRAVVSFSDPVPRTALDGRVTLPGHVGIVYQALSARWTGTSKPDTLRLLPDGTVYNRRAMQKVRAQERGWQAEVEKLQGYGAGPLDREPREWIDFWLTRITRPLRHSGNHRYAWGLDKWTRRALGPPNPKDYPVPPGGRVPPRWGRRCRTPAVDTAA